MKKQLPKIIILTFIIMCLDAIRRVYNIIQAGAVTSFPPSSGIFFAIIYFSPLLLIEIIIYYTLKKRN